MTIGVSYPAPDRDFSSRERRSDHGHSIQTSARREVGPGSCRCLCRHIEVAKPTHAPWRRGHRIRQADGMPAPGELGQPAASSLRSFAGRPAGRPGHGRRAARPVSPAPLARCQAALRAHVRRPARCSVTPGGSLRVRVRAAGDETALLGIMRMVASAQASTSRTGSRRPGGRHPLLRKVAASGPETETGGRDAHFIRA